MISRIGEHVFCEGCDADERIEGRVRADFYCLGHGSPACQHHRFQLHCFEECRCEALTEDMTATLTQVLEQLPNSTNRDLAGWAQKALETLPSLSVRGLVDFELEAARVLARQEDQLQSAQKQREVLGREILEVKQEVERVAEGRNLELSH